MKVFKFGGASVKDANAVKNVGAIINRYKDEKLVVVISAMGKTTNALEGIVNAAYEGKDYKSQLQKLNTYHTDIIQDLNLQLNIDYFIDLIITNAEANRSMTMPQYYDQIVCIGELISTTIVSTYLNANGIDNTGLDARDIIKTDNTWREGVVNWQQTETFVLNKIPEILKTKHVITQGFIGRTPDNYSTTLGREGSDYTGAILAYLLQSEGLFIWKDVPGVLNADPKIFSDTANIPELTYYEAIEMTYYGATVIHPKTIKPLQNKQIPLYVKSFIYPDLPGTVIHFDDAEIYYPPVLVVKKDQTLLSIRTTDFSFIAEKNLSHIYEILAKHNVKVNMIQTAALSCTISIDTNPYKDQILEDDLAKQYNVTKNENLQLLTIRHYTNEVIEKLTAGKEIILTQKSRNTIQILY
ncbi:MAG: aspartate kinase [Fimbriimonadaceae bacterium]|nr:aspartate kinase [Chitinophagales bacterium]